MNGNSALLDSNILIYLSKNELPFSILDQFAALFVSVACPISPADDTWVKPLLLT
jgi:predicted nucleic acid-binding protein